MSSSSACPTSLASSRDGRAGWRDAHADYLWPRAPRHVARGALWRHALRNRAPAHPAAGAVLPALLWEVIIERDLRLAGSAPLLDSILSLDYPIVLALPCSGLRDPRRTSPDRHGRDPRLRDGTVRERSRVTLSRAHSPMDASALGIVLFLGSCGRLP